MQLLIQKKLIQVTSSANPSRRVYFDNPKMAEQIEMVEESLDSQNQFRKRHSVPNESGNESKKLATRRLYSRKEQ